MRAVTLASGLLATWTLILAAPAQAAPDTKIGSAPDVKMGNTPASPVDKPTPSAEAQAQQVAEAWLKLVDGADYKASWVETASMFRAAVTQDQWVQSVRMARAPLGQVVRRTLLKASYATELPGAPDGHYVVIQYQTQFEAKKKAIETITPMKDGDGVWRVSGYYVR